MNEFHADAPNWQILDMQTVSGLSHEETVVTDDVVSDAEDRVAKLAAFAVNGNVTTLKTEVASFKAWASRLGLRRIENATIELERVLQLPSRGQAILQAQSLTRFVQRHVADDLEVLGKTLKSL